VALAVPKNLSTATFIKQLTSTGKVEFAEPDAAKAK